MLTPTPAASGIPPDDTHTDETAGLGSLSDYLLPLCIGGGLVVGLGAVGLVLARRRKGQRR